MLDYVKGEELLDYIVKHQKLKESEASTIIEQLLRSIKYIHSKGIIHRDLKPENMMINPETLKLKLIDFGLSSYFLEDNSLHTKVGTPTYAAPEVILGDYSKEADLWSVGIICYVMLTGCPPFQADNMKALFQSIVNANTPYYVSDWKHVSKEAKEFVKGLIVADPEKRMTVDEALNHPWIQHRKKYDNKIEPEVFEKLSKFKVPDILKKEVFLILANQISEETIHKWNKTFEELDTEGTGMITVDALIEK